VEWVWVGGRAGIIVASLVGAVLFLRDTPAYQFVLGCIAFATIYDTVFLFLLLKKRIYFVFFLGLVLDAATLLAGWWAVGESQADVRTTNDLYLILFPMVVIGVARFGWLLGTLYASLWLFWLSWSTYYFYDEGSYEVEQLPLRLLFLAVVAGIAIYLISRLNLERRHAEEISAKEKEHAQLIEKVEARFRYLADSSSDAVIIADSTGHLIAWNRGAERIFGYTEKEAVGKSITEMMPDKYRTSHVAGLQRYLSTGQSRVIGKTVELEGLRKTGLIFPVELSIATWQEGQEKLFGAIVRDITDRKKLESEYLQSQKLESLGRLVSAVSHDFNNFLTPITGFAGLGKDSPNVDAEIRAYFEQIYRAAEQAHNLSNQLVQMSGKQPSERHVLDLNKGITDIGTLVPTMIGKDVEFVIELDQEPQLVLVDSARLQQVLMNLIVNAKDAMPGGGKLTITTNHKDESGFVHMSVKDTGTGMTDEVKARLFEPFFTTKESGKGTGLGLATCYQIIKDYEGRITVDSEVGKGTTFHILLPRHEGNKGG